MRRLIRRWVPPFPTQLELDFDSSCGRASRHGKQFLGGMRTSSRVAAACPHKLDTRSPYIWAVLALSGRIFWGRHVSSCELCKCVY